METQKTYTFFGHNVLFPKHSVGTIIEISPIPLVGPPRPCSAASHWSCAFEKKTGKNQTPMKKPWMLFLGNSSLGTRASKEVNYIYTSYYHIVFLVHSWYWNVFPNTHAFSKFCGPGIPTNKGIFESYLNELGLCLNDFIDFHDSLEHLRSKSAPLRSRVLDHATTIPFSQAHLLGGHLSESAHVPQSCCHGVSGTWWDNQPGKNEAIRRLLGGEDAHKPSISIHLRG